MSVSFPGLGSDSRSVIEALRNSQAYIEFDLDGKILNANDLFCNALGYTLAEIKGKHHSMFVEQAFVASSDYREFWASLKSGKSERRQYKRLGKGGKEIWIEASYNAVGKPGKPYKVVKIATDVTAAKMKSLEEEAKMNAVYRSQAVIEFTPDGQIIAANENFCSALGYQFSEIQGQHHRMFCDPAYIATEDYRTFWLRLAEGHFSANEYLRLGKAGKEVWIQATYNPIFDSHGRVYKVVKFATDVTERMNSVSALASALDAMANGDLCQRLEMKFVPTMENVRKDFNIAIGKLRDALATVGQNAHAIANNAAEIRANSNDFAKRTENQAASVEETAAALEEITTTVADSSARATEAGKLVRQTKDHAEQSGKVVQSATEAMDKIEGSSREIANIISVIDEIAFQTNLLALNAGVEAARAGDAGRGFAVVAQEVRELAQRSAKAAKEIKALINTSSDQVKTGVALVGQTGRALTEIVGQVTQIDVNVTAIVEAAREQAIGLGEINTAVNSMDQGTQQNAAMVEESSAAAHALAKEADILFALLGQFNVGAKQANTGTRPASEANKPVSSPARQLVSKVTKAYAGGGSAAAAANEWKEF